MTASDARPPSDTGPTGWHTHSGRAAYRDDQCARHADDVNPARPVIVVDPAEARETIARTITAHLHGGRVHSDEGWVQCMCGERLPCEFEGPPHHDPVWDDDAATSSDYLALHRHQTEMILAALAGQGQP